MPRCLAGEAVEVGVHGVMSLYSEASDHGLEKSSSRSDGAEHGAVGRGPCLVVSRLRGWVASDMRDSGRARVLLGITAAAAASREMTAGHCGASGGLLG